MIRIFTASFLLGLAGAAFAQDSGQDGDEMTCSEFVGMDMENQMQTMSDLYAQMTDLDAEAAVPQESVVAGEEAVTRLTAACGETPDRAVTDVARDVYDAEE